MSRFVSEKLSEYFVFKCILVFIITSCPFTFMFVNRCFILDLLANSKSKRTSKVCLILWIMFEGTYIRTSKYQKLFQKVFIYRATMQFQRWLMMLSNLCQLEVGIEVKNFQLFSLSAKVQVFSTFSLNLSMPMLFVVWYLISRLPLMNNGTNARKPFFSFPTNSGSLKLVIPTYFFRASGRRFKDDGEQQRTQPFVLSYLKKKKSDYSIQEM